MTMNELNKSIKEYDVIIKEIKRDYTREQLTISIIRKEHPELNFMDDEEIWTLIKTVNKNR